MNFIFILIMSSDFRLASPHPIPSSSGGGVVGSGGNSINELLKFKDDNVLVGLRAGLYIDTFPDCNDNVMIGTEAGLRLEGTSSKNIFVGTSAGDNMQSGNNNMILGVNSRFNSTVTCNDRIIIGSNVTTSNGDFTCTLHPDYTMNANYYNSLIPSTGIKNGFSMTNLSQRFTMFLNSNGGEGGNSIFSINKDGFVGINTSIQNREFSVNGDMETRGFIATQNSTFSNNLFIGGTLTVSNANFSSLVLQDLQVMNLTAINNFVSGVNVLDSLIITQDAEIIADNVTFLDSHRNVFCNDLTANGNISFSGTNFVVDNSTCKFNATFIQINSGVSGAINATATSSILVNRGNGTSYFLTYDESIKSLRGGLGNTTGNPFVSANGTTTANNLAFFSSTTTGPIISSNNNLKFNGTNFTLSGNLNVSGDVSMTGLQKFTLGLNTTRNIPNNQYTAISWTTNVVNTPPVSYWSSSGSNITNGSTVTKNWLVTCHLTFAHDNVTATYQRSMVISCDASSFTFTQTVNPTVGGGTENKGTLIGTALISVPSGSSLNVQATSNSANTIKVIPPNGGSHESFISIIELP